MKKRPARHQGGRPRIGLLGGSFNPAHDGHVHISRLALACLGLDQVWWLVSPQNPLKPRESMAPLKDRLKRAQALARGRSLWVTDIERQLGTRYTVDTLTALRAYYPGYRFVWIMGADNLIEMHRWKDWMAIFRLVPVAVFARPTYSFKALVSRAAGRLGRYRQKDSRAARLADKKPPAWVFLMTPLNAQSATKIRSRSAPRTEIRGERWRKRGLGKETAHTT